MKRSHLSNFALPLSPLAAIHSRYRSVSVTVLLDVNVIGISPIQCFALSTVSPRLYSELLARVYPPPPFPPLLCHTIVLGTLEDI